MSKIQALTILGALALAVAGPARAQDPLDAEREAQAQAELQAQVEAELQAQAQAQAQEQAQSRAQVEQRARELAELQAQVQAQEQAQSRAQAEQRARELAELAAREAELAREQAEIERARARLDQTQESELLRSRRELEQARAQLERAARDIATRSRQQVEPSLNLLRNFSLARSVSGARLGLVLVESDRGALVTQVTPDSAAESAGIAVGDVIQSIDGIALAGDRDESVRGLVDRLGEIESGESVNLVVERAGARLEFDVEPSDSSFSSMYRTLVPGVAPLRAEGPGSLTVTTADGGPHILLSNGGQGLEIIRPFNFANSPWGDMEIVMMTEALGRYFGTSEGLLVVRGPEDDAIAIEDGDVILSISGRTPNSPEHALRILSSFEAGETIEFSLMRNRVPATVEYLVPEVASSFDGFDPDVFER